MRLFFLILVSIMSFESLVFATTRVQLKTKQNHYEILSILESKDFAIKSANEKSPRKQLRKIPYFIEEHGTPTQEFFEEWLVEDSFLQSKEFQGKILKRNEMSFQPKSFAVETEVRTIVDQGPLNNRINLTILGDGYTSSEKERFFSDAERTVKGLFEGNTFKSYLPLFNVHAVFVASNQSGIGDGKSIDTAFKLYRTPKGSKRAIYPGDESALESALRLAPATDYPIVIANDEFYGGLGGRYAISTRSEHSGLVVLRHELGHNFGEVGEEYDNGQAYFGANNSSSTNVSWSHWVDGKIKINESKLVSGDYVWKNLKDGKYQSKFKTDSFPGGYFYGMISSVGWQTPTDVIAKLDNVEVNLNGVFNSDRNFYEIKPVNNFSSGNHTFSVEENIQDGDNVLGFATLFVAAAGYDFTKHKIGAYSTFNQGGSKSYRPTHDSCIMREMSVDYFCSVDKENIWYKLLNRVSLIDKVEISNAKFVNAWETNYSANQGEMLKAKRIKTVKLNLVPLDGLEIHWYKIEGKNETEIVGQQNKTSWTTDQKGKFRIRVNFQTMEVVKYNKSFEATTNFSL